MVLLQYLKMHIRELIVFIMHFLSLLYIQLENILDICIESNMLKFKNLENHIIGGEFI